MGRAFWTFDHQLVVEELTGELKGTAWAPGLDDGKHREVIEVALGKRKLLERKRRRGGLGEIGVMR